MSFIKEYFTLTKQYTAEYGENMILLMQCGAFFEVYGLKDKADNIYGSNICDFSRIFLSSRYFFYRFWKRLKYTRTPSG